MYQKEVCLPASEVQKRYKPDKRLFGQKTSNIILESSLQVQFPRRVVHAFCLHGLTSPSLPRPL